MKRFIIFGLLMLGFGYQVVQADLCSDVKLKQVPVPGKFHDHQVCDIKYTYPCTQQVCNIPYTYDCQKSKRHCWGPKHHRHCKTINYTGTCSGTKCENQPSTCSGTKCENLPNLNDPVMQDSPQYSTCKANANKLSARGISESAANTIQGTAQNLKTGTQAVSKTAKATSSSLKRNANTVASTATTIASKAPAVAAEAPALVSQAHSLAASAPGLVSQAASYAKSAPGQATKALASTADTIKNTKIIIDTVTSKGQSLMADIKASIPTSPEDALNKIKEGKDAIVTPEQAAQDMEHAAQAAGEAILTAANSVVSNLIADLQTVTTGTECAFLDWPDKEYFETLVKGQFGVKRDPGVTKCSDMIPNGYTVGYNATKAQLADTFRKKLVPSLATAQANLSNGFSTVLSARNSLNTQQGQLNTTQQQLKANLAAGNQKIETTEQKLNESLTQLDQAQDTLNKAETTLQAAETKFGQTKTKIQGLQTTLEERLKTLQTTKQTLEGKLTTVTKTKQTLDGKLNQVNQQITSLENTANSPSVKGVKNLLTQLVPAGSDYITTINNLGITLVSSTDITNLINQVSPTLDLLILFGKINTTQKNEILGAVSSLNTIPTAKAEIDTAVKTINNAITKVDNAITTIKNAISTVGNDITLVTNALSTVGENISTINSAVTTITGKMTDVTAKITEVTTAKKTINDALGTIATIKKQLASAINDASGKLVTAQEELNQNQVKVTTAYNALVLGQAKIIKYGQIMNKVFGILPVASPKMPALPTIGAAQIKVPNNFTYDYLEQQAVIAEQAAQKKKAAQQTQRIAEQAQELKEHRTQITRETTAKKEFAEQKTEEQAIQTKVQAELKKSGIKTGTEPKGVKVETALQRLKELEAHTAT